MCWEHCGGCLNKKLCRKCRGASLCWEHGARDGRVRKAYCIECRGSARCWEHSGKDGRLRKEYCRDCRGTALCFAHCDGNKLKYHCADCGGKRLCSNCHIWKVPRQGAKCVTCRTPEWQGKIKEKAVGLQLLQWASDDRIPLFTFADKIIPGSGLRYRVDFAYDLASHFVGVEIDEHQHSLIGYVPKCELVRMGRLAAALNKPSIWIRWNPDSFKIGETADYVPRAERVSKIEREALLLLALQEALERPPAAFLTVIYICYSQPAARMEGQKRAYVTVQPYATEIEFEAYVGSVYPNDCAAVPSGTLWHTQT